MTSTEVKFCQHCNGGQGQWKPRSEFYQRGKDSAYVDAICKECKRTYNKQRYALKGDEIRAHCRVLAHRYYERNRDVVLTKKRNKKRGAT